PVGQLERAVKWARRRPALAALTVVSLAALLVLVVGGLWFTAQLQVERNEARKAADKATKARDFLVSIFKLSDRKGESGTLTARQILDHADRRIAAEFADQPELRADLENAIEEVYASLGTSGPQAMILETRGAVHLEPAHKAQRKA